MKRIRFEILSIMQTMHGLGIMPDEAFQREKERLVPLISEEGWRSKPLVIGEWIGEQGSKSGSKFNLPDPTRYLDNIDDGECEFNWKVMVADLLESAYREANGDDDVIEHEISHLGVAAATDSARSVLSYLLHRRRATDRRLDYLNGSLNDDREGFRSEIAELREEVRQLRRELRANSSSEVVGAPSKKRPDRSSNAAEIDDLQQELARCFSFAAQHEAKGEAYAAGQLRGQAARLESKLRDLGA